MFLYLIISIIIFFGGASVYSLIRYQFALRKLWLNGWQVREIELESVSGWGSERELQFRQPDDPEWIFFEEAWEIQNSLDLVEYNFYK